MTHSGKPIVAKRKKGAARVLLVVVHPTWVHDTKHDIAADGVRRAIDRAELVLHRIEADPRDVVVVGPYNLNAVEGSAHSCVASMAKRAIGVYESRGSFEPLRALGRRIAGDFADGARFVVAGFYRDLCCASIQQGLAEAANCDVPIDRTLSMAIPRAFIAW